MLVGFNCECRRFGMQSWCTRRFTFHWSVGIVKILNVNLSSIVFNVSVSKICVKISFAHHTRYFLLNALDLPGEKTISLHSHRVILHRYQIKLKLCQEILRMFITIMRVVTYTYAKNMMNVDDSRWLLNYIIFFTAELPLFNKNLFYHKCMLVFH